jgi:hypothetical protein
VGILEFFPTAKPKTPNIFVPYCTIEYSTRQGYRVIMSLFILFQIPMLALELPRVELYKCNISTCNPITCKPTIFPFLLNCVSLALVGPLGPCQKESANIIRERRNHVMMKVEHSLVTWYKCKLTIAFCAKEMFVEEGCILIYEHTTIFHFSSI